MKMRRLKGWLVSGESVAGLMRCGNKSVRWDSSVPKSAKFVNAYFEPGYMSFVVVFEDESFKEVPEGLGVPLGRGSFVIPEGYHT